MIKSQVCLSEQLELDCDHGDKEQDNVHSSREVQANTLACNLNALSRRMREQHGRPSAVVACTSAGLVSGEALSVDQFPGGDTQLPEAGWS